MTTPWVAVRFHCWRHHGMSYLVTSTSAMFVCIQRSVCVYHGRAAVGAPACARDAEVAACTPEIILLPTTAAADCLRKRLRLSRGIGYVTSVRRGRRAGARRRSAWWIRSAAIDKEGTERDASRDRAREGQEGAPGDLLVGVVSRWCGLRHNLEPAVRCRHAGIHGGLQQHLFEIARLELAGEAGGDVQLELFPAAERSRYRKREKTTGADVEA